MFTIIVFLITLGTVSWILVDEHESITILSEQSDFNANAVRVSYALLTKMNDTNTNSTKTLLELMAKLKEKLGEQDQTIRNVSEQLKLNKNAMNQFPEFLIQMPKITCKLSFNSYLSRTNKS